MSGLLVDKVFNAVLFAVIWLVWIGVSRRDRKPHLQLWTLGFAFFMAYTLLRLAASFDVWPEVLWVAGRAMIVAATTAVVAGTVRLLARPFPRAGLWLGVLLLVWLVVSYALDLGTLWKAVPVFWWLGLALGWTGVLLARARVGGAGRWFAAFGFCGVGLYSMAAPFLAELPWYRMWEEKLDLFFIFVMAVGVVMLHFEFARQEADDSAERHRSLFASAIEGLFRLRPDGRVVAANPAFLRMLSYSQLEDVPPFPELFDVDDARDRFGERLAHGASLHREETAWRRSDGTRVNVILATRPAAGGEDAAHVEGSVRDVTDERELQRQLAAAQRMESLGRLAGGIAHDFNNLVTVILAGTRFVADSIPADSQAGRDLATVRKAATRAADLTGQLLAFSRRDVAEREVLDLNEVTSGSIRMLERVLGEDVELRYEPYEGPLPVSASRAELEQVVVNLALNARDAMPDGGRLEISTTRTHHDDAPNSVELVVRDTGQGMPPDTLDRIFEPFFTTKEGRGTGLGLATVYGILRRLGGDIAVSSEAGRGTEFRLEFPLCDGRCQEDGETESENPDSASADVVVVEDDEIVRDMLGRVLTEAGHQVRIAASGAQALDLIAARRPDLIVTDVVMPEMSGLELVRRVRETWPDQRAVYLTGYTAERITADDLRDAFLLTKPFGPQLLLRTIEHALTS